MWIKFLAMYSHLMTDRYGLVENLIKNYVENERNNATKMVLSSLCPKPAYLSSANWLRFAFCVKKIRCILCGKELYTKYNPSSLLAFHRMETLTKGLYTRTFWIEIKWNLMENEECAVIFGAEVNWIRPISFQHNKTCSISFNFLIDSSFEHSFLSLSPISSCWCAFCRAGKKPMLVNLTYCSIELKASENNNHAAL